MVWDVLSKENMNQAWTQNKNSETKTKTHEPNWTIRCPSWIDKYFFLLCPYRSRSMSLFRPMFFTSWQIASFLNNSLGSKYLQIPMQYWGMTWFAQRDWSTGQEHGCSVGVGIFETNTIALMILSWIKGSRFVTWSLWAVGNMESNDNDVEWCGHQFKQLRVF